MEIVKLSINIFTIILVIKSRSIMELFLMLSRHIICLFIYLFIVIIIIITATTTTTTTTTTIIIIIKNAKFSVP